MNFIEKLTRASQQNHSLLCIGLDPDPAKIPAKTSVLEFNKAIIDATRDLVCAYKPNFAFYEALGREGSDILKETVSYIPKDIPVIGDAKRGDIGNTAQAYARNIFDYLGCDATTVNPYLGFDALEPFLQYQDKGVFILCRTSNAGAADFQSLPLDLKSLIRNTDPGELFSGIGSAFNLPLRVFDFVAEKAQEWNVHGNIGLVVGATYPDELARIRRICPDLPLLIPGIGAQGGDLALTVRYGVDQHGRKAIINSSRQIIYASKGKDFAKAARRAAQELRDKINRHLAALQK